MLHKFHSKKGGFTLVEIMIVVAIIALLAAIAVPSFLRARLRSQATTIVNELRLIDAAKDQYMIENDESFVDPFDAEVLAPYLKPGTNLYTTLLNASGTDNIARLNGDVTITFNASDELPSVEIPAAMDEVTTEDFWSPYAVSTP